MKHAFISPVTYFDQIPDQSTFHLCLAHLLPNEDYRNFYLQKIERGDFIILDNGAFENKVPYPLSQIGQMCHDYKFYPNVIVLPDYPMEHWTKTITESVLALNKERHIIDWNCQFMAVPQSERGDWRGWLAAYRTLSEHPLISWVGMSILGIPNAFCELTGTNDVSFNRTYATAYLIRNGLIQPVK
ncbi:MAG: hypothetical protein JHC54_12030, partial [Acinetobacter sp.]|nr:hypothetical protein [Acinetobacter sp.]